jgi:transcription antitermination factor NusG
MGKRWYVLHSASHHEHIAATNAAALGFPVFVPIYTTYKRVGRKEIPDKNSPLFPGYIFVIFDTRKDRLRYPALNHIHGAVRVKHGLSSAILCDCQNEPVAVPYRVMRALRNRDKAARQAKPRTFHSPFKVGQRVKVVDGPFTSFEAVIESTSSNARVKALLEIFGRKTPTEFDVGDLCAAC